MSNRNSLAVNFPDPESLEKARTILAYESLVRDCAGGKVLAGLVYKAADIEHYPDEVIECLQEICGLRTRKEVERFISGRQAELLS